MNRNLMLYRILLIFCTINLGLSGCSVLRHNSNGKWGFIDRTGKLVIPYRFDEVSSIDCHTGFEGGSYDFFLFGPFRNFSEGLCAVRIGKSSGYIDKTGQVIVSAQFSSAGNFSEGLACVRMGDKIGYIDKTGKISIPITLGWFPHLSSTYKIDNESDGESDNETSRQAKNDACQMMINCCQFSEGLAAVYSGQKCGYIDKTGKYVIPPRYILCSRFKDGMATVSDGTNMYRLDKFGKIMIKLPSITEFYGDGLFVQLIGKHQYVFVEGTGKRMFPQVFACAKPFSEGLAAIAPNAVSSAIGNMDWGYIDKSGTMVIPPNFFVGSNDRSCAFVDGLAVAAPWQAMGGNAPFGVIDRAGKWIVQPRYYLIGAYRDGLAWAIRKNNVVYLDKNGREVISLHTNFANSFSEGLAAVRQ